MTDLFTPGGGKIIGVGPSSVQERLRQLERLLAKQASTISRFERILIANNLIDSTNATSRQATSTARATTVTPARDRFVAGKQRENPQYTLDVEFSDDGEVFSEPLVNPVAGQVYQIRARVTQHHSGNLFSGVHLRWRRPAGWTWTDGYDAHTYHETISNPLVITRKARYSSGLAGWRVVIEKWYV